VIVGTRCCIIFNTLTYVAGIGNKHTIPYYNIYIYTPIRYIGGTYLYFIRACTAHIGYNNIITFSTRINKNVKQLSRPAQSYYTYICVYYETAFERYWSCRRLHLRVNILYTGWFIWRKTHCFKKLYWHFWKYVLLFLL